MSTLINLYNTIKDKLSLALLAILGFVFLLLKIESDKNTKLKTQVETIKYQETDAAFATKQAEDAAAIKTIETTPKPTPTDADLAKFLGDGK